MNPNESVSIDPKPEASAGEGAAADPIGPRLKALGIRRDVGEARAAQRQLRSKLGWGFKLYGREGKAWWIHPRPGIAHVFEFCYDWMLTRPIPLTEQEMQVAAGVWTWHLVWDIYAAAAFAAGVSHIDVSAQFEAETGVPASMMPMPVLFAPPDVRADAEATVKRAVAALARATKQGSNPRRSGKISLTEVKVLALLVVDIKE